MGTDARQIKEKMNASMSSGIPDLNPWSNPRKRPYSWDPSAQLETTTDEAFIRQAEETEKGRKVHSPKRLRVEEWPLKSSDNAAATKSFSQPARRKSPSPRRKGNGGSSTRPSKFLEGSMNDKISQRPPSLYIREEEAMEHYSSANMEDVDIVYDAGIESNKPTGMFRFGKVIANAFSSVNVWQGLNGIWKEKEKENQAKPERDVLKAKAEQKYAELKKSGYKGTQNAPTRSESQEIPAVQYEDTADSRRSSFRDSAVDVDEYRSSSDRRDKDQLTADQLITAQLITATETLMPPPALTASRRFASPFSDASSGRRLSIHFRKPSLEGLKRATSQIHLPSIKKHTEDTQSVPSIETDDAAGPGLRREPSKKDIAKQYKLSKKVSDLETKLEAARRELEISIQTAPPVPEVPARIGRKRFVPRALASLPSERLLTPQTHNKDGTIKEGSAQVATVVDVHSATTSKDNKGDQTGEQAQKAKDENAEAAQQASWNKRAQDIAARNVAARQSQALRENTEIDDVLESEAAKNANRRSGNPRKSLVIKFSGSQDSSKVHNRPPKVYAKTPRNSPITTKNVVPPIPTKRTVFDPTKVDQAEIMAMRAIPDSHAPFGKAWDDLKNLRKQYPDATEVELQAYMSSQSPSKKVTDYTSVSHRDRPSSPFLGRPAGSVSPMKTRARASRHGISPPPPSLSSAKKFHKDLGAEKSPVPARQKSPQQGEEADAFAVKTPLVSSAKIQNTARASLDKPLPDIKTDEFEWDDDVF